MKKIIVLSLFTFFCLCTYAQETPTNSSIDSLEKEILKALNETAWKYYYWQLPDRVINELKLNNEIKIENESLILSSKKKGVQSISLVNSMISCTNPNPNLGIFIQPERGSTQGLGLSIVHPHIVTTDNQYSGETKMTQKKSLKLYELIKMYHDFDYLDSIAKQRAKELDDFSKLAQTHHASSEKPTLTEEQRKYIVQANATNKAMNYEKAIELYTTVAKINPTSYPEGYYNMALIAAQMKNYEYAIFNMKKYLIISPDASDARAAQDKIYEWELSIK
jgi:tetratricopeptide (TPR) repeat protein